ncbi:unnamed protein product [Ectocarpus sp. CCAP 1310/34]|nr:unnamed protein product [Ectocarpus sp. CCAP 1310/34]
MGVRGVENLPAAASHTTFLQFPKNPAKTSLNQSRCTSDHTDTKTHIYPKRVLLEGLEIEIFKLVSYSATPEQWKEWLQVPLERAAALGNRDLFYKLLEAGAYGSAGWRGCRDRSLIDAAAVGGNVDVVSGFLEAGAEPDVQVVSWSSKTSALCTPVRFGHEDVARRLVTAGADVNFVDPMRKSPAFAQATRAGYEQLVGDI